MSDWNVFGRAGTVVPFAFQSGKPGFAGYLLSSSRLCFAHALSGATAFVAVPHGHLPSFFAMDMQGQDLLPMQAQT
jgi:hypothetical protein